MISRIGTTSAFALILAACGGPIETRVRTLSLEAALPGTFMIAQPPGGVDVFTARAQQSVAAALRSRGWRQSDTATHIVSVGVAARPAGIALTQRDQVRERGIALAEAKPAKPLQSCQDVEHRIVIAIAEAATGDLVYNGSAAEYHCNAGLADTLDTLTSAAMVDLGAQTSQTRTILRNGLE